MRESAMVWGNRSEVWHPTSVPILPASSNSSAMRLATAIRPSSPTPITATGKFSSISCDTRNISRLSIPSRTFSSTRCSSPWLMRRNCLFASWTSRSNRMFSIFSYEMKMENIRLEREVQEANKQLRRINQGLEQRVEEKIRDGMLNLDMLRVSQEILENLPVAVIGVGEDGLIAVANRMADELLDAGSMGTLVGCHTSERLPQTMADSLMENGKRHTYQLENGSKVLFW